MNEIWKDIPQYEGLYQVSNYGRVKSVGRYKEFKRNDCHTIIKEWIPERIKAQNTNNCGYQYVQLYKNNKRKKEYVHRLVAMAFLPNPDNLPQVNHIDEDKANNFLDNLEWCSAEYNTHYYLDRCVIPNKQ